MPSLSHITAVILAGGQGSRLRNSLPPGTPKALADINGQPFLHILLDRLGSFGIGRVVLCTGYLGEVIQATLGNRHGAIRLDYSREEAPLGTAGALANARPLLPSGPVLVMNGDSYCLADLEKFYNRFCGTTAEAAILLTRVADPGRYGRVEIDAAEHIVAFHEKRPDSGPGMINAGIYLFAESRLQALPEKRPASLEEDIFPALAGAAGPLLGYPTRAPFLDIGTPENYQQAPAFFAGLDRTS